MDVDDIGHMGLEQMLDLLWDQFYWPEMTKDEEMYIGNCEQCIQYKNKLQRMAIKSIQANHPLQLVHLDYLTIEATKGGKDVHVLIITDHCMRYAQALVTSPLTTTCTA